MAATEPTGTIGSSGTASGAVIESTDGAESLESVSLAVAEPAEGTESSKLTSLAVRSTNSSETASVAVTDAVMLREVCAAHTDKMAVAITRSTENNGKTSETPGLGSAGIAGLEGAGTAGLGMQGWTPVSSAPRQIQWQGW